VEVLTYRLALLVDERVTIVILDSQTETSGVDVPVSPDKERTEARLGQEVEDTVEDCLGVRRDDVSTLTDTPCNRVQDPQESGERSAVEESLLNITSIRARVSAGFPNQLVDNVDECKTAESEVSPLVPGLDESSNQTGDNHNLVDNDGPENGGPWHTGGKEEIGKKKRSGNEPIDVANVVDRTVVTTNDRVITVVLDSNGCETEVGTHGEIGNGGNEDNSSGDVVEDAVATLLAHAEPNEDEARDGHGRANGEVEVRAMGCDGNVSSAAIDSVVYSIQVSY
jgi:hypothetical protein